VALPCKPGWVGMMGLVYTVQYSQGMLYCMSGIFTSELSLTDSTELKDLSAKRIVLTLCLYIHVESSLRGNGTGRLTDSTKNLDSYSNIAGRCLEKFQLVIEKGTVVSGFAL
jgi:hypothetical protein